MSRIRILSDHLANQIAAGEVVERPASVVKELVENSLDAGATRIAVQVEGGGTRLLRVVDNGMGMDADDVLLSLERHATSKLRSEDDLAAITTLGFRGEAIPSIASVSRMTILSRPAEAAIGARAEVRFGVLQDLHESGASRGTVIEVRNLFGNIPARKKFLKSARTELHHIEEVIKNLALAHPGVEFFLQVDDRVRFSWSAADLQQRMREVFRYEGELLSLAAEASGAEAMSLDGYLCLPDAVSAATARLRLLVNGRAVQDRMLRHAVLDGMQGFLMKGHSPAGVLRLTLAPSLVDVNVHPAKREIRFRNQQQVHVFVSEAVRAAVAAFQERLRDSLFARPAADRASTSGTNAEPSPQVREPDAPSAPPRQQRIMPAEVSGPLATDTVMAGQSSTASCRCAQGDKKSSPALPVEPAAAQERTFSGLRLIGQLMDLYLLCERDGHLMVIDQHAAHERILFGRLAGAYLEQQVPVQHLLFPVSVELTPEQYERLGQRQQELARLGLDVAEFGDNTAVIKGVPAAISRLDPADILLETLAAMQGNVRLESNTLPESLASLFASLACKAAIKAGNALLPEEMLALLAQMEKSPVFSHCPHGRPVIKTFSRREIEHWFHRL